MTTNVKKTSVFLDKGNDREQGNTYRRNDTVTLALPVWHIATVVNDDVASLPRSFGAD